MDLQGVLRTTDTAEFRPGFANSPRCQPLEVFSAVRWENMRFRLALDPMVASIGHNRPAALSAGLQSPEFHA